MFFHHIHLLWMEAGKVLRRKESSKASLHQKNLGLANQMTNCKVLPPTSYYKSWSWWSFCCYLSLLDCWYNLKENNFQKVAGMLKSGQERETNKPHIQSFHVYCSVIRRLVWSYKNTFWQTVIQILFIQNNLSLFFLIAIFNLENE